MQHCRPLAGEDAGELHGLVERRIRGLIHRRLDIIAVQAETIAELQGLLTATRPPAIDLIRDLAGRKASELGRELPVTIEDVLELGDLAARVVARVDAAATILADAA